VDDGGRGALTRHGREVSSVFDLLGRDENDLTAAFGFTLARSPRLLNLIVSRLLPSASAETVTVRMEVRDEQGCTDLEIDTGTHLAVVEAKRGWLLPTVKQLARYASRFEKRVGGVLVTLSDVTSKWAGATMPAEINGVPLIHLPWSEVRTDLSTARADAAGHERFWLDELHEYMRRAIKVRDSADGWTYCVAVSNTLVDEASTRRYRDFITGESAYFHPHGWGRGWPKTAPNFLAFRWNAQVQQVRRVMETVVVPNLQSRWADLPVNEDTSRPHVIYSLGPPLPGLPIPNGKQYQAGRLWVLLDQLLTSASLADAYERTQALTRP
jgi:hypothetical protein